MTITETMLTVRYAETDQMGIVHHAVYPVWFEAARTDYLRQAGMSYAVLEKQGLLLPLASLQCRYLSPAHYEDEVVIRTAITRMTHVKIFFRYQALRAADGALLAEGETVHACTDRTLRPTHFARRFPEIYRAVRSFAGLAEGQ